jgi:hypothetical protein
MSVSVIIARDEHGAPSTREFYPTADRYVISDGNLDVAVQGVGTLGTYGSGNWLSVYTDDVVEVITVKPEEDSSDFGSDFGDDSSDESSDESSDSSDESESTDESSDESSDE